MNAEQAGQVWQKAAQMVKDRVISPTVFQAVELAHGLAIDGEAQEDGSDHGAHSGCWCRRKRPDIGRRCATGLFPETHRLSQVESHRRHVSAGIFTAVLTPVDRHGSC